MLRHLGIISNRIRDQMLVYVNNDSYNNSDSNNNNNNVNGGESTNITPFKEAILLMEQVLGILDGLRPYIFMHNNDNNSNNYIYSHSHGQTQNQNQNHNYFLIEILSEFALFLQERVCVEYDSKYMQLTSKIIQFFTYFVIYDSVYASAILKETILKSDKNTNMNTSTSYNENSCTFIVVLENIHAKYRRLRPGLDTLLALLNNDINVDTASIANHNNTNFITNTNRRGGNNISNNKNQIQNQDHNALNICSANGLMLASERLVLQSNRVIKFDQSKCCQIIEELRVYIYNNDNNNNTSISINNVYNNLITLDKYSNTAPQILYQCHTQLCQILSIIIFKSFNLKSKSCSSIYSNDNSNNKGWKMINNVINDSSNNINNFANREIECDCVQRLFLLIIKFLNYRAQYATSVFKTILIGVFDSVCEYMYSGNSENSNVGMYKGMELVFEMNSVNDERLIYKTCRDILSIYLPSILPFYSDYTIYYFNRIFNLNYRNANVNGNVLNNADDDKNKNNDITTNPKSNCSINNSKSDVIDKLDVDAILINTLKRFSSAALL